MKLLITEIIEAEKKRASELTANPAYVRWVHTLREKYVVNGFLLPFYAFDGRHSRSVDRINQFGDYILPWEMQGKVLHQGSQGWIRNERLWFWSYLSEGQDFAATSGEIPESNRIDGIPAQLIWQEIVSILKELSFFGEDGGGILNADDIDETLMMKPENQSILLGNKKGHIKTHKQPGIPRWMSLFLRYEYVEVEPDKIEIRPAWFHIARHALYNVPILRLPVFSASYMPNGKIKSIRFLSELSDDGRSFIGQAILEMPLKLKSVSPIEKLEKERDTMTWWLWYNVGHSEHGRKRSYGEIGSIAGRPRSTIQSAVQRFNRKLRNIDGKMLGALL